MRAPRLPAAHARRQRVWRPAGPLGQVGTWSDGAVAPAEGAARTRADPRATEKLASLVDHPNFPGPSVGGPPLPAPPRCSVSGSGSSRDELSPPCAAPRS